MRGGQNRGSKRGWMESLGVHVKWETGDGRWVGQSDAGNTVAFLMVIRLQNHEVLFSYIYLPNTLLGLYVSVESNLSLSLAFMSNLLLIR